MATRLYNTMHITQMLGKSTGYTNQVGLVAYKSGIEPDYICGASKLYTPGKARRIARECKKRMRKEVTQ